MADPFGLSWNENRATPTKFGVIYSYVHKKLGTILIADSIRFQSSTDPVISNAYIYLSVLREYHLLRKTVLICEEGYNEAYRNYPEENLVVMSLSDLAARFPRGIEERENRTLLNLSRIESDLGRYITEIEEFDGFAKDSFALLFIINILHEKKLVFSGLSVTGNGRLVLSNGIRIEEKGWIAIENIEKPQRSKQAFIAMWFDSTLDLAYNAISSACESNDFIPLRIDSKEHNNEISGEILAEIRKSRFIIAEVTGQRHGVYFEAGYALALGLPVIWVCRADELSNVHFDTRQYNHVVWKDTDDLVERLSNRIKGTIV